MGDPFLCYALTTLQRKREGAVPMATRAQTHGRFTCINVFKSDSHVQIRHEGFRVAMEVVSKFSLFLRDVSVPDLNSDSQEY